MQEPSQVRSPDDQPEIEIEIIQLYAVEVLKDTSA